MLHVPVALFLAIAAQDRPEPVGEMLRAEYFVVERQALGEDAPEPIGIVAWRHSRVGERVMLETETLFEEGPVRALHVERITGDEPRLIWRELGSGLARTWLAEWDPRIERVRTTGWCEGSQSHSTFAVDVQALMPLDLVERLRTGREPDGCYAVLAPLSQSVESLDVQTHTIAGGRRIVDWRRADGGLAARYVFKGESLEEFQWQEGKVRARRVDKRTYQAFHAEWTPPVVRRFGSLASLTY